MSDSSPHERAKIRVRVWHIALLTLAVLATLGLAWWQWTRFQSGSGTFQNLGYALQWPLFGGFFVYAYKMILTYENEAIEAQERGEEYRADERPEVTAIDESFLPSRPQLNVEEFNRLNHQRRGHHSQQEQE